MVRTVVPRRIPNGNKNGTSTNNTNTNWDIVAIYLISLSTFATLVSIFGPTIYIVEHHHETSMDVRMELPQDAAAAAAAAAAATIPIIDVDDLLHEDLFKKTIKQCLPSLEHGKCHEFVPEPLPNSSKGGGGTHGTTKVQRVAVVTPPGDISDSLVQRVQHIAREHNQAVAAAAARLGTTDATVAAAVPMEVIVTSHVPPYGYGKTHGYTKVIRLVPEPFLLEVTDALTSILLAGESHTTLTLVDIQAALRMILRFHCRLSHLAAHTALLSLPLMELLSDTTESMERLRTFLAAREMEHVEQDLAGGGGANEEDEAAAEFTLDDDQSGLMDAELAYGSQMLTRIQTELLAAAAAAAASSSTGGTNQSVTSIYDILDQVLMDEMRLTKDMSIWPCPSFWTAAAGNGATTTGTTTTDADVAASAVPPLSPALIRLAQALSPDCDDPYNTCFVERDKCEFAGDPVCHGT